MVNSIIIKVKFQENWFETEPSYKSGSEEQKDAREKEHL